MKTKRTASHNRLATSGTKKDCTVFVVSQDLVVSGEHDIDIENLHCLKEQALPVSEKTPASSLLLFL